MDIAILVIAAIMACGIIAEDRMKTKYYTVAFVVSLVSVVLLNVLK